MKRWPLTVEHKEAISRKLIGRKKSKAHRAAIARSAKPWSDEARRQSALARMHKAENKRKLKERMRKLDDEMTRQRQRDIVKQLTTITSPQARMMWDRRYVPAGTMSPRDLSMLWILVARQHSLYSGKTKWAVTTKGMAGFVRLREWLSDLAIYPERYFRAIFQSASFARSRGRAWKPFVTAACSNHYFETYAAWERRLVDYDEGWIELMKETGVHRLPPKVQDQMLESAESLASIADAVSETIDVMVDRYFVTLSPYLLYFMPEAQEWVRQRRGTKEQQSVFRSLDHDSKLRDKYRPFYDAAKRYFKFLEINQEKRVKAHDKIMAELDRMYPPTDVRLDLVDPKSL